MIFLRKIIFLITLALILAYSLLPLHNARALAGATASGTLLIGQIKISSSNGQFVSLYNNTSADIDMSTIQLAYYNYYDLSSSKLTSSRYIPLSGKLAPRNYYMVSDGAMMICYKMTVNATSLGFSSTAGTLQVTQNGPSNILDTVSWSKTAVVAPVNVQTLPTAPNGFLQRAWLSGITKNANDPWVNVTPTVIDGCDLQTQLAASTTPTAPLATDAPQKVTAAVPVVDPAASSNLGLVAPEITELLPNPGAPQSDDTDEFIELYNPNDAVFNLTNYRLEVGTSYSRGFTFKAKSLQPKSYTAFKITDTNLQLSNTEGQVRLLSPEGTTISETPGYETAPDGESWSIIGDSWQWTDVPTPNAVNVPSAALPKEDATPVSKVTKTTKSTKTTTPKKTAGKVAGASTKTPSGGATASQLDDAAPLHPLVLAGVGAAAVAYALYEYRRDMANRIIQLRSYLKNRRAARA